eukprot:jgi/Chrzof1/3102/Cz12g12030.t1
MSTNQAETQHTAEQGTDTPSNSDIADLLQAFLQVQARRAEYYTSFHDAFKTYMATKAEGPYKHAMQQLTAAFGACSRDVIAVENCLRDDVSRSDLTALLRSVQSHEKNKLQLTLSLQALKAAHAAGRFSWQQQGGGDDSDVGHASDQNHGDHPAGPGQSSVTAGSDDQRQDDAATPADPHGCHDHHHHDNHGHNDHGAAAGGHVCGHHGGQANMEPSEYEYHAAVKEAVQQLDAAVKGINEALDEVRYAVEDLKEQESLAA